MATPPLSFSAKLFEFKKANKNYKAAATQWLSRSMQTPHAKFPSLTPENLRLGAFYFMRYDLSKVNKTSRMEQYSPIMLVDYKPMIDSKVIYALNLNFLTTQKKEAFFSSYLDSNARVLAQNDQSKDWMGEAPLPGVTYPTMHGKLLAYGFDYAIREYRLELVNKLYGVSTGDLEKLILLNTQAITGVDEAKINDIWIAKLKKESLQMRHEEMVAIKSNYEMILKELAEKFKSLNNWMQGM